MSPHMIFGKEATQLEFTERFDIDASEDINCVIGVYYAIAKTLTLF